MARTKGFGRSGVLREVTGVKVPRYTVIRGVPLSGTETERGVGGTRSPLDSPINTVDYPESEEWDGSRKWGLFPSRWSSETVVSVCLPKTLVPSKEHYAVGEESQVVQNEIR